MMQRRQRSRVTAWSRPTQALGEHLEPRMVLATTPLVITEIMYHPRITPAEEAAGFRENDFEFVEVENVGSEAINLEGNRFTAGIDFVFGSYVLGPRQQAVIARNSEAIRFRHGAELPIVGQYSGSISNNDEQFTLVDAGSQVLLDFKFDDAWYPQTDGEGYSLTVADPLAPASAWQSGSGWRASLLLDGSPGYTDGSTGGNWGTAPQQLTATEESVRHVALSWLPPTELDRPVAFYRLYRNGQVIATTQTQSYLDATAMPNASFVYQVSAVDDLQMERAVSRSVTIEIGPVGGAPGFGKETVRGTVVSGELTEISGLVASRLNPGSLWLVDDHSGQDTVYALNDAGQFVARVRLSGVQSIDWEDIAVGPGPVAGTPYVYVGDIGDNDSSRGTITVYRFPEMLLTGANPNQPIVLGSNQFETLVLQYSSGPRDAEVLLVDPLTGDLFVVTKEKSKSRIYGVSAESLQPGRTIVLQDLGAVETNDPAGGDISPSGQEIVIRNEQGALLYTRAPGQSIAAALSQPGLEVPVVGTPVEPNGEALAYAWDNHGYFTISEGVNPLLYYFPRTGPWAAGDSNRDGLFNSADLVRVFQLGQYDSAEPANWEEGDWNGDGQFNSSDLVWAFQNGGYEDS